MADQRCELTELLVDQCAHCRPTQPPATDDRDLGPWTTAHYDGECPDCGDPITPGDTIRSDGDGDWLCERCGTPPRPTRDVPTGGLL